MRDGRGIRNGAVHKVVKMHIVDTLQEEEEDNNPLYFPGIKVKISSVYSVYLADVGDPGGLVLHAGCN